MQRLDKCTARDEELNLNFINRDLSVTFALNGDQRLEVSSNDSTGRLFLNRLVEDATHRALESMRGIHVPTPSVDTVSPWLELTLEYSHMEDDGFVGTCVRISQGDFLEDNNHENNRVDLVKRLLSACLPRFEKALKALSITLE